MRLFFLLTLVLLSPLFAQEYDEDYDIENGEVKITIIEKDNQPHYNIEISRKNTVITKSGPIGKKGIEESWLTDLDEDDNPEVAIFYYDVNSNGQIVCYEINNLQVKNHMVPAFTDYEGKYYRGHAEFDIDDDLIIQEYAAYNVDDIECCPTAGKMIITYELKNDNLLVKESNLLETRASKERKENTTVLIIQEAIGLPKMDKSSKTDCWLEVFVGDKKIGKTRRIKDNNNPEFNKSFEIVGYDDESIKIVLYDKDDKNSQYIGEVKLIEAMSGTYPILFENKGGNTESRGVLKIKYLDE